MIIEKKGISHQDLILLIKQYDKVAITGPPKAGKTTLANDVELVDYLKLYGDDYIYLGWSECSQMIADIAGMKKYDKAKYIVEGTAIPRALRKGMKVDAVIYLRYSLEDLTPKQASMGRGVITVLFEWHAGNQGIPVYLVDRI